MLAAAILIDGDREADGRWLRAELQQRPRTELRAAPAGGYGQAPLSFHRFQ
jgi:hypothetical protein